MQKTTKVVLGVLGVAVIGFFMFYFGNGDTFQGRLSKNLGKDSSRRTAQDEGMNAATDPGKDASKLPNIVFDKNPEFSIISGTHNIWVSATNKGALLDDDSKAKCKIGVVHASSNLPLLDDKGNALQLVSSFNQFTLSTYSPCELNNNLQFVLFDTDMPVKDWKVRLAEGEDISDLVVVLDYDGVITESNENDNTATILLIR